MDFASFFGLDVAPDPRRWTLWLALELLDISASSALRHSSLSKAARHLAVTHGAVSRQIRLLERYLGVCLLHRRPNGVEKTDAGERLHAATRQASLGALIEAALDRHRAPARRHRRRRRRHARRVPAGRERRAVPGGPDRHEQRRHPPARPRGRRTPTAGTQDAGTACTTWPWGSPSPVQASNRGWPASDGGAFGAPQP